MTIRWILLTLVLAASMAATSDSRADEVPLKSESTALRYSLLGTGVPIGAGVLLGGSGVGAFAILGGAVFGPSLGHFYADRPGRAMIGIGIRSAAVAGIAIAVGDSFDDSGKNSGVLAGGAVAVGAVSMLVDIAMAPQSARVHNRKRGEHRISVVPWRHRGAAGLRATIAF